MPPGSASSSLTSFRNRRAALKRSAFAASLRDAVAALHEWCLEQLLAEGRRLREEEKQARAKAAAAEEAAGVSGARPKL